MPMGRPLAPLPTDDAERGQLVPRSRRAKTAQTLAMRVRIVLLASQGHSNTEVARRVATALRTVGKSCQRYLDGGVDSLLDEPRPGTPRKLSDEQ